jgi:hypothetical protein
MSVDMGQDESTRFERMFHDGKRSSCASPGKLEHHPHSTKPDRMAFVRLHDNCRQAPVTASISFTHRLQLEWQRQVPAARACRSDV